MAENVAVEKTAKKKKNTRKFKILQVYKDTKYGDCDFAFLLIVITLLVMGIIMMFSASYAWAINEGKSGTYYAYNQARYAIVGLVMMFILSHIDYRAYKTPFVAICAYVIPVLLLVAVLFIGTADGGAQRWIKIGGFQFQPSEIMKIGIVISFAYLIEENYSRMKKVKYGILPFVAMLALVVLLLMMQPHLSGTLIICFLCVVLLFIGGTKILHLLITGAIGLGALLAIVIYKLTIQGYGYYAVRIQSWRDPFSDIQGDTWQTCQSLIAIGSGGLFGLGLGESRQKYLYLPESKNDFVFSIVCEELGFVGAMTVILLFILLIFRGLYIASKATDKFGMLIAVGFTFHIGIQAFLNIAVVSNLIMNTGISLPFFSYGGTALILQLCEMGVVLNISRTRYKLPPKRKKKVTENVADYTPEEKLDA